MTAMRVLYVEDDDDIRELVAGALARNGYEVEEVVSAEEGLDALSQHRFGMVISDYHLPGHTGTWMLDEARSRGLLANTSALLLTAALQVEAKSDWPRLTKPVDLRVLLELIARSERHVEHAPATAQRELVLYVFGSSPLAPRAHRNLKRALTHAGLPSTRVRVVDVEQPDGAAEAASNRVAFTPTLIAQGGAHPGRYRVVGDLSNATTVRRFLHHVQHEGS